jgi:hypothetical protein
MKKYLLLSLVAALVLGVAPLALAAGAAKAKPGKTEFRFQCSATIVSVDAATNTFVVKVKAMSSAWKGARKMRGKEVTIAVSDTTAIFVRQLGERGTLSPTKPLAFADLKAGRAVHVSGKVVVAANGSATFKAARIVMFVPTYKFQCNATIVSVDAATNSFVVKVKTMSRSWRGWKKMPGLRGKEITLVVTAATKIFTRQLDAAGQAGESMPATFGDLVPGNKVHIGGRVVAAEDGSNQFNALRVVEFLPAP